MAVDPVKYTFIRDVTPGMKNLYCQFIVLEVGTPRRTKDGHDVYKIRVADKTASILLTVWDEIGAALQPSDICRLVNGYVTVHKLCLVIACGRSGEVVKVGEFCMVYSETPFMSATNPDLAKFGDNSSRSYHSNGDSAVAASSSATSEDKLNFSASNPSTDSTNNNQKSIKNENNGQTNSSAKVYESRDTKSNFNGKSERSSGSTNHNHSINIIDKSNIVNNNQNDFKNNEIKNAKYENFVNNTSSALSDKVAVSKVPLFPDEVFQPGQDIDERRNFSFRNKDVDYRPKKVQNRLPVGRWQPYGHFRCNNRRRNGNAGQLPSICAGPIGTWFPPPRSFANKSG